LTPKNNYAPSTRRYSGNILNDKSYEPIKIHLKKLNYPESISHIELSIQEVGFEDGTVWSGGEFWRPDPNRPAR